MAYATRADLLKRSNARRLAQLAVPADVGMLDLAVVRAALSGEVTPSGVGALDAATQGVLDLMLAAVDAALADADALIQSYGVAETARSPVLTRMACTLAFYYLQGAERLEKDDALAYDGVTRLLGLAARGDLDLTPTTDPTTEPATSVLEITSASARFGVGAGVDDDVTEVGL